MMSFCMVLGEEQLVTRASKQHWAALSSQHKLRLYTRIRRNAAGCEGYQVTFAVDTDTDSDTEADTYTVYMYRTRILAQKNNLVALVNNPC